MEIPKIYNNRTFGITVSPMAYNQLLKKGFSNFYISLIKKNGSQKIFLDKANEISLTPKYQTSIHTDCFFPINNIEQSIQNIAEKLFDKCLSKSAKRGDLIPTYYNLMRDYRKSKKTITNIALKYEDINTYTINHPILSKIKNLFR